jgi:PII-like signaling protein
MAHRRLRIYLGERDKDAQGHVLHEAIVHEAHRRGLAGATVLRGVAGFGARARVHTAKILRLSVDLPVVVEIIDTEEAIDGFLAWARGVMAGQGMVTVEEVRIFR